MKYLILTLILVTGNTSSVAQIRDSNYREPTFVEDFLQHFKFNQSILSNKLDTITRSQLAETDDFRLSISDNLIKLDTQTIVLENPYFSEKWNWYNGKYPRNYPRSYSTIFNNTIITLFDNGKFVCHKLTNYSRDLVLEEKLNTKKFIYHWNSNNNLIARTRMKTMIWDGKKWKKYKHQLGTNDRPLLYEDQDFTVFRDCHGEWGGTVYFFDKLTRKYHLTESTCSNTVTKSKNGYGVLSQLGHLIGLTQLKTIPDPRNLKEAFKYELFSLINGEALGYSDTSNAFEKPIDYSDVLLFSKFQINNRYLYLTDYNQRTFLSEIDDNDINIVHPFFSNDLYTHQPVTTNYNKTILINLDLWGIAKDREVSLLLITNKEIIKLDWNERHK